MTKTAIILINIMVQMYTCTSVTTIDNKKSFGTGCLYNVTERLRDNFEIN